MYYIQNSDLFAVFIQTVARETKEGKVRRPKSEIPRGVWKQQCRWILFMKICREHFFRGEQCRVK